MSTAGRGWRRDDVRAMRLALKAAARGPLGDPNPRVGAVITAVDGTVVGVGHHRGAGTRHAEVAALDEAGERARGGTAYVTLEPCDHVGRTGPCSRALVAAGVARVVYAQPDPNPTAAGGAHTLRAAGVAVEQGLFEADARALNAAWSAAMELGRPFVTWKFAASLDGRSAAADGTSQWITGPAARADVHARRAECGAIVVGTGTALADDPRLTVRDAAGRLVGRQPLRVVVGRRDLPPTARVLDGDAPTLQVRTHDPEAALAALHERGIRHVWLEGGPTLAAAFLRADAVDEVLAYVAPVLLGAGPAAVGDLGVGTLAAAYRLRLAQAEAVGDDVRLTLRPARAAADRTTHPAQTGATAAPAAPSASFAAAGATQEAS
ncbi:MAG: bifunctional diaminohydroxyphosphoribosylaminopyrimidine deaminase/5-amino-6-(5-phosphoribosylamino)uracil reductase RibD [Austwickia sp.]|jgi:diaminohydroxyphosphoribosylaminopyrimidine deaminase/5-amino-6-(5-phosphoribosylamino)uracil reductase|nr:MAG: bifunctional diaminohydroxyphosphoribosylaminopyrimidine deaminase/5-amino-6-(5-phosphoribosylamino)uracil reductase RibD [Austwickia sp.]